MKYSCCNVQNSATSNPNKRFCVLGSSGGRCGYIIEDALETIWTKGHPETSPMEGQLT